MYGNLLQFCGTNVGSALWNRLHDSADEQLAVRIQLGELHQTLLHKSDIGSGLGVGWFGMMLKIMIWGILSRGIYFKPHWRVVSFQDLLCVSKTGFDFPVRKSCVCQEREVLTQYDLWPWFSFPKLWLRSSFVWGVLWSDTLLVALCQWDSLSHSFCFSVLWPSQITLGALSRIYNEVISHVRKRTIYVLYLILPDCQRQFVIWICIVHVHIAYPTVQDAVCMIGP